MVITVTGRKSGKQYSTPIGYLRDSESILALTNGGSSNWHKNVLSTGCATLEIKGKPVPVYAEPITDQAERERIFEMYTANGHKLRKDSDPRTLALPATPCPGQRPGGAQAGASVTRMSANYSCKREHSHCPCPTPHSGVGGPPGAGTGVHRTPHCTQWVQVCVRGNSRTKKRSLCPRAVYKHERTRNFRILFGVPRDSSAEELAKALATRVFVRLHPPTIEVNLPGKFHDGIEGFASCNLRR